MEVEEVKKILRGTRDNFKAESDTYHKGYRETNNRSERYHFRHLLREVEGKIEVVEYVLKLLEKG